jgi:ubiquinone/menaquinone biosynthesis C-methylase UbiE
MPEVYILGHTPTAVEFMARRTFASHGRFFAGQLRPGMRVLDCACGPGSITLGIAERVAPGEVTGVDYNESQVVLAREAAAARSVGNARFVVASCYALPFPDRSFEAVFSHALLEHLAEPRRALAEFHRVLVPGGHIGVCTPDWDGFLLTPASAGLDAVGDAYKAIQTQNGGDPYAGQKLGQYLLESGFGSVRMEARYECYDDHAFIGSFLAFTLRQAGREREAATMEQWVRQPAAMFAQAWVSAIGERQP